MSGPHGAGQKRLVIVGSTGMVGGYAPLFAMLSQIPPSTK